MLQRYPNKQVSARFSSANSYLCLGRDDLVAFHRYHCAQYRRGGGQSRPLCYPVGSTSTRGLRVRSGVAQLRQRMPTIAVSS